MLRRAINNCCLLPNVLSFSSKCTRWVFVVATPKLPRMSELQSAFGESIFSFYFYSFRAAAVPRNESLFSTRADMKKVFNCHSRATFFSAISWMVHFQLEAGCPLQLWIVNNWFCHFAHFSLRNLNNFKAERISVGFYMQRKESRWSANQLMQLTQFCFYSIKTIQNLQNFYMPTQTWWRNFALFLPKPTAQTSFNA